MFNEAGVTLAMALGGLKSFTYIYRYGDNWHHRTKFEEAPVPDPNVRRPLCLNGQVAGLPEDVDGVPGYADFLERSAIQRTRNTTTSLSGVAADSPPSFDLVLANQRLSEVRF